VALSERHDDAPILAGTVLGLNGGDVWRADRMTELLVGDLRSVSGARLVMRLLDAGIYPSRR